MEASEYRKIEALIASAKPEEMRQGLKLVKDEIAKIGSEEARPLFEMVSTIFYIDPLDRPDLVPVLDEAITLIVGFGAWVIPVLVQKLEASDYKAQMASAHALGRMGADAIGPLIAEYRLLGDSSRRAFVLYALGKIKSPKIAQAASLAIEAAGSADRELRDTGTRAIGKLAESIPPAQLADELRRGFVEVLLRNLDDVVPGVRAKAVRSLGKLGRFGHLAPEDRAKLKGTFSHIVGNDECSEWDHAYVVRREAEEALRYV